nr:NADH dehydrogenase subunit 2 [Antennatus tuberosus]
MPAPQIRFLLMTTMLIGTLVTAMSSHWFAAWIGIELNTLAFIGIMSKGSDPRTIEATTKYFVVQATAATMLLFAATLNAWYTGSWEIQQMTHPFFSVFFTLSLAMKLGVAPFHAWFPEVLQGINLKAGFILTTWQKIAPFLLLMQLYFYPPIMTALGLVSVFIGGWGGLNQTSLRKLLAYSSVAHLGWMMIIMQFSPLLSLIALLLYFSLTAPLFLILSLTKSTTIKTLASSSTKSLMTSLATGLLLLSYGGLPPLAGFMSKWFITSYLVSEEAVMIAFLMLPSALLSLYFYVRITYLAIMSSNPNNTTAETFWRYPRKETALPTAMCVIFTLLVLPLVPTILVLCLF